MGRSSKLGARRSVAAKVKGPRPAVPRKAENGGVMKPAKGGERGGRGRGRGRGGRGRGRGRGGENRKALTPEQLDEQMEKYYLKDEATAAKTLDSKMDEYWSKKEDQAAAADEPGEESKKEDDAGKATPAAE